ncbi:MAG: YHS domain-containing protein [Gammaproteobacteria bacterium]|nr:YHS domain-containing protein [Gammaproteobacteria bacterium]MBU1603274.1 YHS domain-containing protein [Gammaproteobacteria bacterium]MBU2432794.1 YHS domain-containing protein [Gammaproteobacteria bacterium]MBU2450037.1 YHS domain-containing protein [Gammaproteobacteria bacterium]
MTGKIPTSRDPVCGMDIAIADSRYSMTHRGLVFHFCCGQCLERFTRHPALYTRAQRTADIRPIAKKHKLQFVAPDAEALRGAGDRLLAMMGVTVARAADDHLLVEYDLWQASLEQIEAVAEASGLRLKGGLHGWRRAWWRFAEGNELDNMADTGSGACCNRPPARLR